MQYILKTKLGNQAQDVPNGKLCTTVTNMVKTEKKITKWCNIYKEMAWTTNNENQK